MNQQLSLFDSMEQPLPTIEQLEQQVWFMKNETIHPYMQDRWEELRSEHRHYDALAIASEFIVR